MQPSTSRMVRALAAASTLALALAACGGGGDGGSGTSGGGADKPSEKAPLVFGTTDAFGTVDPAGSYDNPGWEILYNAAQTLLSIPPGGTSPEPDAAESCDFSDPKTYTCTLKDGLKFSDGSPLTSADVKFTFDRMFKIADPNGPSSIFATTRLDGGARREDGDVQAQDPRRHVAVPPDHGCRVDRAGREVSGGQAAEDGRRHHHRLGRLQDHEVRPLPADHPRAERELHRRQGSSPTARCSSRSTRTRPASRVRSRAVRCRSPTAPCRRPC